MKKNMNKTTKKAYFQLKPFLIKIRYQFYIF